MLIAVDKVEAAAEGGQREFRVEELAEAAGITTRTLRFYRERKLLQPPRKEGRIAWYGEAHLSRLRMIAELLERGHTLGGITELIGAGESGRDVADLIGLEAALVAPWSDETTVHLDWDELKAAFGDQLTEENTAESIDQGFITVEDDGITHVSRRLMDATTALVAEGVPLSVVLAASRMDPGARDRDSRDLHRAGPRARARRTVRRDPAAARRGGPADGADPADPPARPYGHRRPVRPGHGPPGARRVRGAAAATAGAPGQRLRVAQA